MNTGSEVFKLLAWKQALHTLALVWQSLWYEAAKGEFGDVRLAESLNLKSETYLALLGTLVKLDLIRVFRDAQDRREITQIFVRAELDQPTEERLIAFRTTGELPSTMQKYTDSGRGIFYADNNFEKLLYEDNIILNNNFKYNTNTKQITLEGVIGETFEHTNSSPPISGLVDQLVEALVTRTTLRRRRTQETKRPVPPTKEEIAIVRELLAQWHRVMGYEPGRFDLAKFRVRHAVARLREKRPESEFVEIMEWCADTPHMMGQNQEGRAYNDFQNLFGSEEKFEKYLKIARTKRGRPASRTSESLLVSDKPTTFRRL